MNQGEVLVHGIRGAFIPAAMQIHLRRHHRDELPVTVADAPGSSEMLDQRLRAVLDHHMHGGDPGVVEITQDKIDETVRASEGHGGFTAYLRQGHQSFTLAAGKNQGQDTRLVETRMSSHMTPWLLSACCGRTWTTARA